MALSAEQILAADDLPRVRVEVPEWAPAGTDPKEAFVFVRTMTGDELCDYEESLQRQARNGDITSSKGLREFTVALATCDESGKPIFTREQVAVLGTKSQRPLRRLFAAISDLNALNREAKEELEKN